MIEQIELTQTDFKFDGVNLNIFQDVNSYTSLFGKHSRVIKNEEHGNVFYFWDQEGLYVVEDVDSGEILEFNIAVNQDDELGEYYPESMYQGKILMDGFSLTNDTSIDELNDAGFSDPDSDTYIEKKFGKLAVIAELDDDGKLLSLGVDSE